MQTNLNKECCEKCICKHNENDYDGPTHCTRHFSGCECHSPKSEAQGESWEPTEAQKQYWSSMTGKRGVGTPRWKGQSASKNAFHKWMSANHGTPKKCENPYCPGKSDTYDWCLKTDRTYSHDRADYLRMCRSCHRKYDLTLEKRLQAIKNLWWYAK